MMIDAKIKVAVLEMLVTDDSTLGTSGDANFSSTANASSSKSIILEAGDVGRSIQANERRCTTPNGPQVRPYSSTDQTASGSHESRTILGGQSADAQGCQSYKSPPKARKQSMMVLEIEFSADFSSHDYFSLSPA